MRHLRSRHSKLRIDVKYPRSHLNIIVYIHFVLWLPLIFKIMGAKKYDLVGKCPD